MVNPIIIDKCNTSIFFETEACIIFKQILLQDAIVMDIQKLSHENNLFKDFWP